MMLRTVCGVLVAGGGSVWWACLDLSVSLCVCAERLCVSVGAVGDRRYESDVATTVTWPRQHAPSTFGGVYAAA